MLRTFAVSATKRNAYRARAQALRLSQHIFRLFRMIKIDNEGVKLLLLDSSNRGFRIA